MKRPRCRSWCVAGAVALALGGGSDARAQIDSTLVLRLQTNLPESSVFADSVRLGPASLGWYRMPRATREIRLVPNEDHNWSIAPVGAALDSHLPSDTLRLHLDFPYYYRFDSAPFGATVSVGTSSGETQDVGQTPVIFSSNAPLVQPVRFELAGHVPADVAPGRAVWNRHFVELHRVEGAVLAPPDADYRPRTRRKWIDAAALEPVHAPRRDQDGRARQRPARSAQGLAATRHGARSFLASSVVVQRLMPTDSGETLAKPASCSR